MEEGTLQLYKNQRRGNKTIAVIAARGGSKRLPRKNIREFCGLPLVAWAIIQAKTAKHIDQVYVSTDDDEIAEVSKKYGAFVLRRPDWPDADGVSANRVFIHAIGALKKIHPEFCEMITMLPTTPLNLPGDIDNGIEKYREFGCDRLLPLIEMRETVVLKKIHHHVGRVILFDKFYNYLHESNAWVVTSPEWYSSFNGNISDMDKDLNDIENWGAKEWNYVPARYWQYADVDTLDEFRYAENIMEYFILKGRGAACYYEYEKENRQFMLDFPLTEDIPALGERYD